MATIHKFSESVKPEVVDQIAISQLTVLMASTAKPWGDITWMYSLWNEMISTGMLDINPSEMIVVPQTVDLSDNILLAPFIIELFSGLAIEELICRTDPLPLSYSWLGYIAMLTRSYSMIAIEYPERYLCQHGQHVMAGIILDAIQHHKFITIRTNSEVILNTIRIAIKEEHLIPAAVVINYASYDINSDKWSLTHVDIDKDGQLSHSIDAEFDILNQQRKILET